MPVTSKAQRGAVAIEPTGELGAAGSHGQQVAPCSGPGLPSGVLNRSDDGQYQRQCLLRPANTIANRIIGKLVSEVPGNRAIRVTPGVLKRSHDVLHIVWVEDWQSSRQRGVIGCVPGTIRLVTHQAGLGLDHHGSQHRPGHGSELPPT